MKRTAILALAFALLAGCTDESPTASDRIGVSEQLRADALADGSTSAALAGLDDALERIVPAFQDTNARRTLEAALNRLRTALVNADTEALPGLIQAARSAVDRSVRSEEDEADLAAIRLAVDHAADSVTSR